MLFEPLHAYIDSFSGSWVNSGPAHEFSIADFNLLSPRFKIGATPRIIANVPPSGVLQLVLGDLHFYGLSFREKLPQ